MKTRIRRHQVSITDGEEEYFILLAEGHLLFIYLIGDEHMKRFFHACGVEL